MWLTDMSRKWVSIPFVEEHDIIMCSVDRS